MLQVMVSPSGFLTKMFSSNLELSQVALPNPAAQSLGISKPEVMPLPVD